MYCMICMWAKFKYYEDNTMLNANVCNGGGTKNFFANPTRGANPPNQMRTPFLCLNKQYFYTNGQRKSFRAGGAREKF